MMTSCATAASRGVYIRIPGASFAKPSNAMLRSMCRRDGECVHERVMVEELQLAVRVRQPSIGRRSIRTCSPSLEVAYRKKSQPAARADCGCTAKKKGLVLCRNQVESLYRAAIKQNHGTDNAQR